jgi:NTE family protein
MENKIHYLCFNGGGVKGIAHIGALKALEEKQIIPQIKHVIGSSSGSLIATAIVADMSYDIINKIMMDTNFSIFADDKPGIVLDVYNLFQNFGIYQGDELEQFIETILYTQTGRKCCTFEDLWIHSARSTKLSITGTNLTKHRLDVFNVDTTPDMPVSLAVKISCAIPFIYESVHHNGDLYCDGGVLRNFPMKLVECAADEIIVGFDLVDNDEVRLIRGETPDVNSLCDYIINYNNTLTSIISDFYEDYVVDYNHRIIPLLTYHIKTDDFDISGREKEWLIQLAYRVTLKAIEDMNQYPVAEQERLKHVKIMEPESSCCTVL